MTSTGIWSVWAFCTAISAIRTFAFDFDLTTEEVVFLCTLFLAWVVLEKLEKIHETLKGK